ncbi:MAG: hypothetical protein SVR08_14285, partial [Spirochaetota bacterium]|nr:hypothetical protein [Spirochaetota bacterium]
MSVGKNIQSDSTSFLNNAIIGKINPFIGFLMKFFFRKIDFDPESLKLLKEYSGKAPIVFGSFHSKSFSLLILYKLLKKHDLDVPVLALGYSQLSLQTGRNLWNRITKSFSKSK